MDDSTQRFNEILLPGEVLEEASPPKTKPKTKPRKRSPRKAKGRREPAPRELVEEQRMLGVIADGIDGPQTQAARERAYDEGRMALVKNMTNGDVLLPGTVCMLRPGETRVVVVSSRDMSLDTQWSSMIQRCIISVTKAPDPREDEAPSVGKIGEKLYVRTTTTPRKTEEEFFDELDDWSK